MTEPYLKNVAPCSSVSSHSREDISKTPKSGLVFYCCGGLGDFSPRNDMGPPAMHEFAARV